MVIALCGFMGCGKTTFGKLLADKMVLEFCDTDEYIEKKQNQSIPYIFENFGESFFRELEYNALKELAQKDNLILSLGGGAIISDRNKKVLKKYCVVYINCPFEVCYQRIKNSDRPIVTQKSKEQLNKLYSSRLAHYEKVANITICDGDLDKMAEQVIAKAKELL